MPASPRVANVLLWFPLSSETFIFKESLALSAQNMLLHHYTMYGRMQKGCSKEMLAYDGPVTRFGIKAFFRIWRAFGRALWRRPSIVWELMRRGLLRRMRTLEAYGENIWCFMAGFLLAEQCQKDNMDLIHAPWANGPATAAWVASRLTGIPFAFSGRAGDIYPEDGILREKAKDANFIRTNNAANIAWLKSFCEPEAQDKVKLVYNGLTLPERLHQVNIPDSPPYNILAVGRFVRTKGFPQLFTAMARLRREGFPVYLTLVGNGVWKKRLMQLRKTLGLEKYIDMPGFIPNDQLAKHMQNHHLLVVPSVIHKNGDRDGIPNVIMEASSFGLPVVATDVCGIGEVIINGKTGYLVAQRDPAALANAIRHALEHPAHSLGLAKAAYAHVTRMFDTEKNSLTLKELYCQAIEQPLRVQNG